MLLAQMIQSLLSQNFINYIAQNICLNLDIMLQIQKI